MRSYLVVKDLVVAHHNQSYTSTYKENLELSL